MNNKTGIFSFFAGAGFLDLGFEKTGKFETLFVNEYHKAFMEIYKGARNHLKIDEPIFGHDIKDITEYLEISEAVKLQNKLAEARKSFETIGFIGGPPCPDFSVGGKNKGRNGENGKLSGTYIELICKAKPDFFLFENVKGLYRTAKHREFFESLKVHLKEAGYFLTEDLINAIEYGAPQDRQRIILIGFHKKFLSKSGVRKDFQKAVDAFPWSENRIFNKKEVLDYNWPRLEQFIEEVHNDMDIPHLDYKKLTVQYWFDKNDVLKHPNSTNYFQPRSGLAKFKTIQEGDDLKKSYKRLHRWRYSPTAAYGNNEVHLHPYKARRISAAEALAIQSLPKEFVIPPHISLTDMFKTIGNGVPYLAGRGLALTIHSFIEKLHTKTKNKINAHAEVNS